MRGWLAAYLLASVADAATTALALAAGGVEVNPLAATLLGYSPAAALLAKGLVVGLVVIVGGRLGPPALWVVRGGAVLTGAVALSNALWLTGVS